MKVWIGKSVVLIAFLHSVFGFVAFFPAISEILRSGILNTVNGQPDREWAFWFIACGFSWFLLGWLLDHVDRSDLDIPRVFGVVLLVLVAVSAAIMPASGFWLGFIPAVGLILRDRSRRGELSSKPL